MGADLNRDLLLEETSLMEKSLSILLVEDNPGDVVIIKELLKSTGLDFSLKHVSTLKETLLLSVQREFDIILLDLGLPDSIGLETLKKIQVFNVKSPVVVMTGLDDEDVALESLRGGAQDYLVKNRLTADNILRGIKYGIERKKIEDLLKRSARQFSLLSSTTTAINECEDFSPIYSLICRNIGKLIEKAGIAAIELINQGKMHYSGIEYLEPWYEDIRQVTGLNLQNPVQHPGDQKKEILDLFDDGKFHKINVDFQGSHRLAQTDNVAGFSKNIPEINIYAIGFPGSGITYGGALIFSVKAIEGDDITIIETISNQVSLCVHRMTIEQDLKVSENQFRKLSKELELKVRERTRDLETTNYQLNFELVERHMAEEALKKSEARLKELNATKDKFFNIIAHDLKNPFTCLLGSTELLLEKIDRMDNGQIIELVQILNDSAKGGFAILQNLLDWSRSQTGMIRFNPARVNLKEIINDNITEQSLSYIKKEIDVVSEVEEDLFIIADKNMIDAILRNLISNAIKFTHRFGTIKVSASINGEGVTVSVKDTGIGIPEKNINDLFRIETKYSRPGTNMEPGTGLGLKLCKEFVEMQGGKIWVNRSVNKGSEFIFSIPQHDAPAKRG